MLTALTLIDYPHFTFIRKVASAQWFYNMCLLPRSWMCHSDAPTVPLINNVVQTRHRQCSAIGRQQGWVLQGEMAEGGTNNSAVCPEMAAPIAHHLLTLDMSYRNKWLCQESELSERYQTCRMRANGPIASATVPLPSVLCFPLDQAEAPVRAVLTSELT